MRKLVIMIVVMTALIIITGIGMCNTCYAGCKSNKQIAIDYCKTYCINYDIKIVNYRHVPKQRITKNCVYIERIKTKSIGKKTGLTKDGYIVKYCKSIPKGKTEYVYLVYNPKSNACDDIICFVSNHKQKSDKVKIYRNVNCCNCDGTSNDCVYYIHNLERHMTENEIAEFEEMEWDRY